MLMLQIFLISVYGFFFRKVSTVQITIFGTCVAFIITVLKNWVWRDVGLFSDSRDLLKYFEKLLFVNLTLPQ
jgi:hypothetical protein